MKCRMLFMPYSYGISRLCWLGRWRLVAYPRTRFALVTKPELSMPARRTLGPVGQIDRNKGSSHMKKLMHVLMALALAIGLSVATTEQAEARRGVGIGIGIGAGLLAGAIIGSHAYAYHRPYYGYYRPYHYGHYRPYHYRPYYRPHYYSAGYCRPGPRRCGYDRWGAWRCWRARVCY